MEKKSEKKRSHTMGLRMDDDTFVLLEKFSQQMDIKKSTLLKLTFKLWTNIRLAIQEQSMILISKTLFIQLINNCPKEILLELAKMDAEKILNRLQLHLIDDGLDFSIENFIDYFTQLFSEKGVGWFNRLQYKIQSENKVIVYGNHTLNHKLSMFFRELMITLLENGFNYRIIKSPNEISDTTISLKFKPND
ncbi:MAG: hypothetical protein ACFFCE_06250 [Promethearchaeota archaeon]